MTAEGTETITAEGTELDPVQITESTEKRTVDIKICQTNTLVLVSIFEPDLKECHVSVLLEPESLSVAIARPGLENPVISGKLSGSIQIKHCRVRVKKDSVVVKLRKTVRGRWRSIIDEPGTALHRRPLELSEVRQPLKPKAPVEDNKQRIPAIKSSDHKVKEIMVRPRLEEARQPIQPNYTFRAGPIERRPTTKPSEKKVKGLLDTIKQFHQDLFFDQHDGDSEPTTTEDENSESESYIPLEP